jgi:hypothetical protein
MEIKTGIEIYDELNANDFSSVEWVRVDDVVNRIDDFTILVGHTTLCDCDRCQTLNILKSELRS